MSPRSRSAPTAPARSRTHAHVTTARLTAQISTVLWLESARRAPSVSGVAITSASKASRVSTCFAADDHYRQVRSANLGPGCYTAWKIVRRPSMSGMGRVGAVNDNCDPVLPDRRAQAGRREADRSPVRTVRRQSTAAGRSSPIGHRAIHGEQRTRASVRGTRSCKSG